MRKNIHKYFLEVANLCGKRRGTCDRGKSGAVIVRNGRIISTGYVGAPSGLPHCDDVGHEIVDGHCLRSTHAEQNAIINAAREGVSTDNANLYCTMVPCYACAKMIINAGIREVYADYDYHASSRTKEVFSMSGVKLFINHKEVKEYGKKRKPVKTGRRKPLQRSTDRALANNRREQS